MKANWEGVVVAATDGGASKAGVLRKEVDAARGAAGARGVEGPEPKALAEDHGAAVCGEGGGDDAVTLEEGELAFLGAGEGVPPDVLGAALAGDVVEAVAVRAPNGGEALGGVFDGEGEGAGLGVVAPDAGGVLAGEPFAIETFAFLDKEEVTAIRGEGGVVAHGIEDLAFGGAFIDRKPGEAPLLEDGAVVVAQDVAEELGVVG